MILTNTGSVKYNAKSHAKYNRFCDKNDFSDCTCPKCNVKGRLIRNTTYIRNIKDTDNNLNDVKTTITIVVVKCLACNHYHALLPTFIFPYHISSAQNILSSINYYFNSTKTCEKIAEEFDISTNLLFYCVNSFKSLIPRCSIVLELSDDSASNVIKNIVSKTIEFLISYYSHHKKMFFLLRDN